MAVYFRDPMRPREFAFSLDPEAPEPLYRQLMGGLLEAIREGHLQPGMALPSTRDLAERCGINRGTVLAAFRELEAEGWIEARTGSGSFVAAHLPEAAGSGKGPVEMTVPTGFDLWSRFETLSCEGVEGMDLREAWPDPRLLPGGAFAEAYQKALSYRASEVLRAVGGDATFLRALPAWLGERRGLWVKAEHILVTRGERGALEVALRGLVRPGKGLALAFEPTPALRARIEAWGHVPCVMPKDLEGPRPDLLLGGEYGLVVVPPRLGPGPQPWSRSRQEELLKVARGLRLPVLELEGPWELHAGPRPPLPLAAADTAGVTMLAGGFEDILAPGLRLGYLVGPRGPIQSLSRLASRMDLLGEPLLAAALAQLMAEGTLASLLRRLRKTYRERGEAAAEALRAALGPSFPVELPGLGLGLWLQLPPNVEGRTWIGACRALGVQMELPREGGGPLHLGFGALDPDLFARAAGLMAQALVQVGGRT